MAAKSLSLLTALPRALKLGRQPLRRLAGPGVWLRAHCLDEYWPFLHCSLRITPTDPARWQGPLGALLVNKDADGRAYTTHGAGPVDGRLVNGFNRDRDVHAAKVYAECLVSGGPEENALIQRLLDQAARYHNDEPFTPLFKPGAKAHNCNSYVAALLRQAEAPRPRRLPAAFWVPGFRRPLPETDFN